MGMISTLKSLGLSEEYINRLKGTLISIIRSVMPTVIANDIIGAQPMTGPIGQIFTLRARYGK